MPLILAIEPDRRQAAQLTSMVKGKLQAELVLAESAERGLAALGNRVPDLILTSALLSPRDESELGDRLRALDGAAGHVQTLTIPVLATPKPLAQTTRSILSALRKGKARSGVPDGCDPAVFAEQCAAYLERAAAELASLRSEEVAGALVREGRPADEDLDLNRASHETESSAFDLEERLHGALGTTHATQAPFELDSVQTRIESFAEPIPESAGESASAFEQELMAQFDPEPISPVDASPGKNGGEGIEVYELGEITSEPLTVAGTVPSEDIVTSPPPVARVPPPVPSIHLWPVMEGMGGLATPLEGIVEAISAGEADFAAHLTASIETASNDSLDELTLCAEEPQASNGDQARSDWMDVLEVLKRDVQQLGLDRPPITSIESASDPLGFADGAANTESDGVVGDLPEGGTPQAGRRRRRSKDAPVQDEWGFFDPNRCGFAALLAKLEEITEESDNQPAGPQRRQPA